MNFYLVNWRVDYGDGWYEDSQIMVRANDSDDAQTMVFKQLSHELCDISEITTSTVRTLGYE